MNLFLDEILEVLEGQEALYRSLLIVLKEEHDAIVQSKLDQLNEVSYEKEALISKVHCLEDRRKKVLIRLSNSLGYSPKELTLKKLTQLTKEPYLTRIKTCHSNLLAILNDIQEANAKNRSLLMHSIDLVKSTMAILNNLAPSDTVYYCNGKIQSSDHGGRVISGEI